MINDERLYATFMELCSIDSEPMRERLLADHLKERLSGLGFTVSEDDTGEKIGGSAGNLLARLEGTGTGETLLFCCHLDRVAPGFGVRPRIEGGYVVGDGTTVLGADDGAGLAALLEGVTTLRERNIPHPAIELVLTVAEELALLGSSYFDLARVTARSGFVLDASGAVGEIVIQAPEQVKIQAVIHGRKAHAGFNPEQGVSAIRIAAAAIEGMPLLRIDAETTANIGSISAVGPTNIVPDRCELWAEVRSLNAAKLRHQVKEMSEALELAAYRQGGSVELTALACYHTYLLDEEAEPARRAARAARSIGVPASFKSTGGGSDANIFNSRGLPTVVLSCGYEKPHTTEERMPLEQLSLLARWVLAIAADGTS